jgi:hypothetical protein
MQSTNANLQAVAPTIDTQPPLVKVKFPNGGDILKIGTTVVIMWDALDDSNIVLQRVRLSRDGFNGEFQTISPDLDGNARSYSWYVTGPGTTKAVFRVVAFDDSNNRGNDSSDRLSIITP